MENILFHKYCIKNNIYVELSILISSELKVRYKYKSNIGNIKHQGMMLITTGQYCAITTVSGT